MVIFIYNKHMYVLTDMGLLTIFTISLTIVYFLYEKTLTVSALSFLSVKSYILDTVNGIFFGLFTLAFKFLLQQIDPDFNIPLFLIITIILLLVKNLNASLMSLFIPFVYYVVNSDNVEISYLLIGMITLVLIVYLFVEHYAKIKWIEISIFISIIFISFISMFVIAFSFHKGFNRMNLESSLMLSIAIPIIYFPPRTALRISISANILFESINYAYGSYVRRSLAPEAIGKIIKNNKIQKAFLGIFKINIHSNVSDERKKEVIETILSRFENHVPNTSSLFAYDDLTYGFFIEEKTPINIKELVEANGKGKRQDNLQYIDIFMRELSGHYKTIDGIIVEANVKAGISIYGLQSNSIEQLEDNAIFALNDFKNDPDTFVSIFNYKHFKSRVQDSIILSRMDSSINLNNFAISYIPLTYKKTGKIDSYYACIQNDTGYEIAQSVDEFVRINDWKRTFDRYFSIEILNKIRNSKQKVYLEYSPLVLQKNFDVNTFVEKLIKIKINKKKVIWIISYKDINKNSFKVIKWAMEAGLQLAIKDIEELTSQQINKVGIKTVILYSFKNIEIDDIETIYPFVKTDKEIEEITKNNGTRVAKNIS